MATYYLRPISDVSLQHTCSSGSSGYTMIDESTADDNSTYIYNSSTSTDSSSTASSIFNASATIPSDYTLVSATLIIRACRADSAEGAIEKTYITASAAGASLAATKIFTDYTDSSLTIDPSNLTRSGNDVSTQITVSSTIRSDTKNNTATARITQVYIVVEANPPLYGYLKNNGAWEKISAFYKKENDVWVRYYTNTGISNQTQYIKGLYHSWNVNKTLQREATLVSANDILVTDYIAVSPGVELIVQGMGSSATNTMWLDYKSDKTYSDYWGGSGTSQTVNGHTLYTRTLPASNMANIYYIRVNIARDSYNYCKVWQNGNLLFDGSLYPVYD